MPDKIDRAILKQLCSDARISNSKLAKETGINTATITKRIDALIKNDLIVVKASPDYSKLGCSVTACIALNVDLTCIDKLKAKMVEPFYIHLVVTTFGRFDILMLGSFPEWVSLNTFLNQDVCNWPGVKQINLFLISDVIKRHRYLFENSPVLDSQLELDETDYSLLRALNKNGLARYKDIAHEMGINPATVSRRVGSLLKKEVIKIIAVPDPAKFGYLASAVIMLNTDHAKVNDICDELNSFHQIQVTMTLTTGFDILVFVQFPNPELLYQFIKEYIAGIQGVTSLEALIVSKYLKATYTWLDFDNLPE